MENMIIDNIMKGIAEVAEKELGKTGRKAPPYSGSEIKEGFRSFLKIQVRNNRIGFFLNDFPSNKIPDHKLRILESIGSLAKENLIMNVLPSLKQQISSFVFDMSNHALFKYAVIIPMEFKTKNGWHRETFIVEEEGRKLELRGRMKKYISDVIYKLEKGVKDKSEMLSFSRNIVDFRLTDLSPVKVIEVVEHSLNHTFQDKRNIKLSEDFEKSILYHLKRWVKNEFKPLHFDNADSFNLSYTLKEDFKIEDVDPEQLGLWAYISLLRIKFKDFGSSALEDLQIASKDFNSKTAQEYLEGGTKLLSEEDLRYTDKNIECIGNDITASILVHIKNETSESYGRALDFIINLLQKDFPGSYAIELTSKNAKQFFPIRGIAKTSTHNFFANCHQYSQLHNKMEQYAVVAMKEFKLYSDVVNGEKSCLPGSYAVFGLGLTSEKYFSLVYKYLELVDWEHQIVHKYFISNLVDRYGITKRSIVLICSGILSAQFEMIYPNLAALMNNDENLRLLINEFTKLDKNAVRDVVYSIWGRNYPEAIEPLNPELVEQLLQQVNKG